MADESAPKRDIAELEAELEKVQEENKKNIKKNVALQKKRDDMKKLILEQNDEIIDLKNLLDAAGKSPQAAQRAPEPANNNSATSATGFSWYFTQKINEVFSGILKSGKNSGKEIGKLSSLIQHEKLSYTEKLYVFSFLTYLASLNLVTPSNLFPYSSLIDCILSLKVDFSKETIRNLLKYQEHDLDAREQVSSIFALNKSDVHSLGQRVSPKKG